MREPTPQEQAFVDFLEAGHDLNHVINTGVSNLNRAINGPQWRILLLPLCRLIGHRWEGRIYPYCSRCNEIQYS